MSSKSPITCHVLDSSTGKPASGVAVILQSNVVGTTSFTDIASGITNADGRCTDLLPSATPLTTGGIYKVTFKVEEYFARTETKCFYPWVEIPFTLENPEEHYHIPLLISPFSFTTYRGS